MIPLVYYIAKYSIVHNLNMSFSVNRAALLKCFSSSYNFISCYWTFLTVCQSFGDVLLCLCCWRRRGENNQMCVGLTISVLSSVLLQISQTSLHLLSFLHVNTNPSQDLVKSLTLLENVFMVSYPNKEGTLPTPKPGSPGLHSAALQAWSLLVTLCPASKLSQLLDLWVIDTVQHEEKKHLPQFELANQSANLI